MPNWKKLIVSGSDATLNTLNTLGAITGSDIQIDDWGSVSASLANITAGTPSINLQQVTDSGSITTNAITASAYSGSYIDLDLLSNGEAPPYKEGRLWYDTEQGAFSAYNDEADITLQIGQEFYKRSYNDSGQAITNGTPVRLSGSQGDMPLIWPALAEDHSVGGPYYNNHIIGVTTHTIEDKSVGYVTELGVVRNIDTNKYNAGDTLYLQTGSAGFRNTPPPFPYDIVQVGTVIRSDNNGFIEISPKEPIHFGNISGLSGSASEVGDLWVYQSNNAWSPSKILSGSYTIDNGDLNVIGDITSSHASILGNASIDGDLTVGGTITAQEFHTQQISSSIIYKSGSTKFGDSLDDTHDFTGSVNITGSLLVNDSSLLTSDSLIYKRGNVSTSIIPVSMSNNPIYTAYGDYSAILSGEDNMAASDYTAVVGGAFNRAGGNYTTIIGGTSNQSDGQQSAVIGGSSNQITSGGSRGVIIGGFANNLNHTDSYIIGTGLTSNANCTTFVNNLNVSGSIIVGESITGNFSGSSEGNFTGSFTGSFIGDGSGLTGITATTETAYLLHSTNNTSIIPQSGSNVITGCYNNIGGGCFNTVQTNFSTIAGGCNNRVNNTLSFIGNGWTNTIDSTYSNIVGGNQNCITSTGNSSTIGGGSDNCINNTFSFIGGGTQNNTYCTLTTIGGGCRNEIFGNYGTIAGGWCNLINSNADLSFIGGGRENFVSFTHGFIGGGYNNYTQCSYDVVVGGQNNRVIGCYGFIGGGYNNCVTSRHGSILGGNYNALKNTNSCCSRGSVIVGGTGHNTSGGTINTITGDFTSNPTGFCNMGRYSIIGGGCRNCIEGNTSVIVGGFGNYAPQDSSFIGGGALNEVGFGGAIGGGFCNTVCNGSVVGGNCNQSTGNFSHIGGGLCNISSERQTTIAGGFCNQATEARSFIGGGCCNIVSGCRSGILGGGDNTNACADSFIIGSNLTATKDCTTFMNNLDVANIISGSTISGSFVGDGNGLTGISGDNITAPGTDKQILYNSGSNIASTPNIEYTNDRLEITGEFLLISSSTDYSTFSKQSTTTNTTSQVVAAVNASNLDGVFFDYIVKDGTGQNKRMGTVYTAVGSSTEFTDISTLSLGDTEEVFFSTQLNGGNIELIADTTSTGWIIKTLYRTL